MVPQERYGIMDASVITVGVNAPGVALTLNRVALGTFFAISGYHKLFNASRHATLIQTLRDDGVRALPTMQWLVPGVEFSAGCARSRLVCCPRLRRSGFS